MNNTEKTNVFYSKANKLANSIYELFDETFAELPIVVYCVGTERWHNHVVVEVWVCIGNGFAPDDVREAVGSVSMSFTFASWRHEKTSDFIKRVKDETNAFLRKVIMQGLTGQEQ